MIQRHLEHADIGVQLILTYREAQAIAKAALEEYPVVADMGPKEIIAYNKTKERVADLEAAILRLQGVAPYWEGGNVTLDWELLVGVLITSYTVPAAEGFPTPTYTVTGLPRGITFDASDTRILAGAPTSPTVGTIVITATNSQGTADYTINYVITIPPDDE